MERKSIGSNVFIYPMPVTLVGTMVDGRPNFMAVGWISRVNASPPLLAVGINRKHHTARGIEEGEAFSVNFPTAEMMDRADYCGLVSGRDADKSRLFDVFYANLSVPMIQECPLCLECRLWRTVGLPSNDLFIGEIVESHALESCLSDGKPDLQKMRPLLLTMPDNSYWTVGERVGRAWEAGMALKEQRG
ncbi:MAG: flavin reductase family protein [Methanosarcinales archaeon]|nr:flavin reductase family protein [Methanosarcinales archaeon]